MTKTLQQIVDANPEAETFRFGDTATLCAEINALVRNGAKTTTCDAAAVYGAGGDSWPEVGRRDIALNWDGTPAVMIETVEVTSRRFSDVDAEFVADMGEFRNLAHWREVYEAYFRRNGDFSPDMKLMCERFKMVEDFGE